MHFQSVRQKKGNIHNKSNKYRWHFRSKFHQTTSLMIQKTNETDITSAQGQPRVLAKLQFELRMTTPVVPVPTFITEINIALQLQ